MADNSSLLNAVTDLARLGGNNALASFRRKLVVEYKKDGSPVTEADKATEILMREWITKRFPGDGIFGEEFAETNPGAKRRWILDPIDGTFSYMRGVPLWGTLVAVLEGEHVLAGAIFCPGVGEMVSAAEGAGCWSDGVRCQASNEAQLSKATVIATDIRFASAPDKREKFKALVAAAGAFRGWSDCYAYLLVATGRAEVVVDPVMQPWDAAALVPVIKEAGGVLTDWSNRETAFGGSVIATNAALAQQVRSVLGAV